MSKMVVSVKCPRCDSSLMDHGYLINNEKSIRLLLKLRDGTKGSIHLSAIYCDYNYTSNLSIPDDDVVRFYCPHCEKNLQRKKIDCDFCNAPMITFNCEIGGRISICTRHGCKNHYVAFESKACGCRKRLVLL